MATLAGSSLIAWAGREVHPEGNTPPPVPIAPGRSRCTEYRMQSLPRPPKKKRSGENKYGYGCRTAQRTRDAFQRLEVRVDRSAHPGVPSVAKTAVVEMSTGPSQPCSTIHPSPLLHVKTVKSGEDMGRAGRVICKLCEEVHTSGCYTCGGCGEYEEFCENCGKQVFSLLSIKVTRPDQEHSCPLLALGV